MNFIDSEKAFTPIGDERNPIDLPTNSMSKEVRIEPDALHGFFRNS
jgi:hypothetical protein